MSNPLYAYTNTDNAAHLIRPDDHNRTLCRQWVALVPTVQPVDPAVCEPCALRAAHGALHVPAQPTNGVCPVCVSEEDLDDHGRIKPHKQVYGLTRTDVDCPGAGQAPEVTE